MAPLVTLDPACTPRRSVFEQRGQDTVYNLDDLSQIEPGPFFTETYVTEGMQVLLTEAFKRLEGKTSSASGTFLLSQSMGGGKTHNLIALGLLARHPEYRERVMGRFYDPGPLGAVRVVSFSGRKTNTPFGIWGEIAEQLNKRDVLRDFYSPLRPPGAGDWVDLLRGEPLLLLLDELPPYFEQAKAWPIGSTYLDVITTTALANLLVAVNGNKLPQACVVLTDLSGAAYRAGGAAISEALTDLEHEVDRGVVRIDPVRLTTNELYYILRTRLFETLPTDGEIDAVADAYREAVERARLMDITTASPEQLRADVRAAYPFHPAIRHLYARFKENPGFQQTRALIRLMRLIVADLWETGAASQRYLIGAHDLDLHQQDILSEIRQINPTLETAIAHDVAAEGGASVAEQIDQDESSDAQDVCRLVFLSSLSQAVNPTLGLDRPEIVRYLAAPARDLARLNAVIDRLQGEAWYLHATRDGKLLFKNVENLVAKLDTYTRGKLREQREGELRDRLKVMFKPVLDICYQEVCALPALDEVRLAEDRITLVIFRPSSTAMHEIETFWEYQLYKNRVLFVTGNAAPYETVLQRAAELSAIGTIIDELKLQGLRENDPQMEEADRIKSKTAGNFYQACRETFQTVYYPAGSGLVEVPLEPKYVANDYKGEEQVTQALTEAFKFTEDTSADGPFRNRVENRLWLQEAREVAWGDLKRRAATDPSWGWHHPRALEALKEELVRRDIWREHDRFVERGPFPKPRTAVIVQQVSRDDNTGQARLRVRPQYGDTVYYSDSGPATIGSVRLAGADLPTSALRLSLLAVDSTGDHETGEPYEWKNTITVKYRYFQDADQWRCELQAVPAGALRYTTDGSGPESHGIAYSEPFVVPPDSSVVLAVAEADGVRSAVAQFDAPKPSGDGEAVVVDPARPATWRREHKRDDTNGSYTWLDLARQCRASLGDLKLTVVRGDRWVELLTAEEVLLPAAAVVEHANRLKEIVPDGNLDLRVGMLRFETGRDLQDMVRELKGALRPGEVQQ